MQGLVHEIMSNFLIEGPYFTPERIMNPVVPVADEHGMVHEITLGRLHAETSCCKNANLKGMNGMICDLTWTLTIGTQTTPAKLRMKWDLAPDGTLPLERGLEAYGCWRPDIRTWGEDDIC